MKFLFHFLFERRDIDDNKSDNVSIGYFLGIPFYKAVERHTRTSDRTLFHVDGTKYFLGIPFLYKIDNSFYPADFVPAGCERTPKD